MGFEVVTTFAGDMQNPKKEIPKAIVVGGILIAIFYLFGAFGVSAAIPYNELSVDSGFMDAAGTVSYTHLDVYKRQRLNRYQAAVIPASFGEYEILSEESGGENTIALIRLKKG